MKKIALIDNFNKIDLFRRSAFEDSSMADILLATGGNTGNVAFVYAIEKVLRGQITRINWGWKSDIVNQRFDHIVVCAANQVGGHVDLGSWADRLGEYDLPVSVIGLGAQSSSFLEHPTIPNGTVRFLRDLQHHRSKGPNILVRGKFTQDVLQSFGIDCVIGGCPSLLISNKKN